MNAFKIIIDGNKITSLFYRMLTRRNNHFIDNFVCNALSQTILIQNRKANFLTHILNKKNQGSFIFVITFIMLLKKTRKKT